MATFNMTDWQLAMAKQTKRMAMPIMTHPGIDLAGKKVMDAVTSGEVQFEAIRLLAKEFPSVCATMMMDLTVEAEAFGSTITFSENEVPAISGRLVHDKRSVDLLAVPDLTSGRIPEYVKAASLAAENIADRPVLGGCIGPFSLAGRLFDMTEIMTAVYLEPDTILALLEKCNAFIAAYAKSLKAEGLNGIIMAEPAAGLLDETLCDMFSSAFVRKIVDVLQDESFMVILHNCGNTGHVTDSMVSTGAAGLHFGNRIHMKNALEQVPSDRLVFGNLDPVGIFKMSSPSVIKQEVSALLISTAAHANFIVSSGCDTPPGVPPENIRAFFDAVDEFNRSL